MYFFLTPGLLNDNLKTFVLKNVRINTLFEIKQGIPISTKLKQNKSGHKYKIIQMSDILSKNRNKLTDDLNEIFLEKEIKKEKLIIKGDYLITCKGKNIKGLGIDKDLSNETIANSHIIILRPLYNTMFMEFSCFINFLHIKLDEFIEEYNNSNIEDNYITIKNIGNKEIIKSIDLFQLNKFDDLYKEYIELNNQLTEIESKIKITINENNK
jgi:hypothetical protein